MMKLHRIIGALRLPLVATIAVASLVSCSKENDDPWWDKPGEEKPDPKPNPDPNPNPTKSINAFMWIDAGGNFEQFALIAALRNGEGLALKLQRFVVDAVELLHTIAFRRIQARHFHSW